MRVPSLVTLVVVSFFVVVPFAAAQQAPAISAADMAVACAPPPAPTSAAHALRVIGAQDTVPRTVFGPGDLVIVSGGTDAGVQLGAEFFVRRTLTSRSLTAPANSDVITDGWVRIVAVNDDTSIAHVERSCGAIFANDFLEPYAAPSMPAVDDTPIDADFSNLARVVGGSEGHRMAGINQMLIIDRGSEAGVQPGARFAIYRDLTAADPVLAAPQGTPLTPIGEAVVISATGDRAVARIVRARDAILAGDYAAPQKP